MYERDYAYTRKLEGTTVADATTKVREALAKEGFGVLTEIDVRSVLKAKLNIDRKPYLILGACNPSLSHRALEAEPPIGVFLPCNVDVFEGEDGATYVQTLRPIRVFGLVGNPKLSPVAEEVEARLRRVLDSL